MKTLLLFALLCGAVGAGETHANAGFTSVIDPNITVMSSTITISSENADKLRINGHIVITNQEASDVVKAVEILTAPNPSYEEPQPDNPMLQYTNLVHIQRDESPAGLRRRADWLEKVEAMKAQRESDLAWARAVLEKWKAKAKGIKP